MLGAGLILAIHSAPAQAGFSFRNCSPEHSDILDNSLAVATQILKLAEASVVKVSELREATEERRQEKLAEPRSNTSVNLEQLLRAYELAFGKYDHLRYETIEYRMGALSSASRRQIDVTCEAVAESPGCQKGYVAYVPGDVSAGVRKIVFCPPFFSGAEDAMRKIVLYDGITNVRLFRACVVLHELSHLGFWDVAQTVDHRYDLDAVQRLATKNPDKSVENADSYHVFVVKAFVSQ